jgi:hypothetical protein
LNNLIKRFYNNLEPVGIFFPRKIIKISGMSCGVSLIGIALERQMGIEDLKTRGRRGGD